MGNYNWGNSTNNNGYNGYWPNPGVKTVGIPMPSFRLSRYGTRPFYMGSIHRAYGAGPASIWQVIYYAGVETQGGYTFGDSGGSFDFAIRGSAGTLQFGRCEPCGRSVQSENEAFSWGGTLAGSFDWAECPTPPQSFTATLENGGSTGKRFSFGAVGSADNGGSTIHAYVRETQVNGGAWGSATTDWGSYVEATPGNSYRFRLYAANYVSHSQETYTSTIAVPYSGGRRMTGAASSVPLTISRRFDGVNWKDLTIRKRHNGSTFVDITN